MGKCKVCGAEIADTEVMCEDCKNLDDVDLIKSDDELEELLNSVMHSHTSYPNDERASDNVIAETTTSESIEDYNLDEDHDISSHLDSITDDLLQQYQLDEEEEEEPFSIDTLMDSEEEPFAIDTVADSEEEPFSIDTVTDTEEEPFSIDSLMSEEEPAPEEGAFEAATDETMQEEPEQEEPFSIDSLMSEEEEAPESDMELHNDETPQVNSDLYADIPGFEGIFDGIDEEVEGSDTSDVGDVFADVLGTVSNYGADEDSNGQDSESNASKGKASKKSKKAKKAKKSTSETDQKGFFKRLFGNVEDENAQAEYEKQEQEAQARLAMKAQKKEEKAAAKADKKAKAAEAKKSKAVAAAAKKAEKEARLAEEEKDFSKINKKGAAVVFVTFAALCAFIVIGTNTFSYSASISQAEDYFARQKYSKAYDKISGIDVKKADQELVDKIKTVMYVNKEYDSYTNYYAIQYYAEALNSLLNGLTKYDVYIEQASELGVKSDLQYVKSQILEELSEKYNLDEKAAKKITSIKDEEEYSDKVFEIAEQLVSKKKGK